LIVLILARRRHQHFDILAGNLRRTIAEQSFARRVEHRNRAGGIDQDYATDRCIDYGAQPVFTITEMWQRLLLDTIIAITGELLITYLLIPPK
jgi:hypothetical protein